MDNLEILQQRKPISVENQTDFRITSFVLNHGDLESIRKKLALSKKEISELLWVDPSAWSRWTKGVSKPPAHIYRALQWYLELLESNPQTKTQYDIEHLKNEWEHSQKRILSQIESLTPQNSPEESWRLERQELLKQLDDKEKLGFTWKMLLLGCLILTLFNLFT